MLSKCGLALQWSHAEEGRGDMSKLIVFSRRVCENWLSCGLRAMFLSCLLTCSAQDLADHSAMILQVPILVCQVLATWMELPTLVLRHLDGSGMGKDGKEL